MTPMEKLREKWTAEGRWPNTPIEEAICKTASAIATTHTRRERMLADAALYLLAALDEARRERDEAMALKVPPTVDALLAAQMDAATARAERDAMERERDAYKRAKAENDERFMRERDEARERCREAAQVLIEAVGADGPCDVGDAARRAVEALGAARAAAIEECAKVCEGEAAAWWKMGSVERRDAAARVSRSRALLEPGT